ncbi:MAG TPA: DNA replication and repair protein RecF [Patescibacteria group bacterium]|nr:DNA replication and repair protein RecF [Patescibacteria group bacterium]
MTLRSVYLHQFRSYPEKKFDFSDTTTIIVGPNTAGKTNLTEAIFLLSTGKSFRGQSDSELIAFEKDIARVGGLVEEEDGKTKIEVAVLSPAATNGRFGKKYFINGVAKTRLSFRGVLPTVLFRPEELDIVIAGPSLRREFLDTVLETVDRDYYHARIAYEKALRQRNALLGLAKETGRRNTSQFSYWDNMVITHGQIISQKRQEFIEYLNSAQKEVMDITVGYDHSIISEERLAQYSDAEVGAGTTLVGPHRDDFFITTSQNGQERDVKQFGSRGQQRLVVLQLKLLQIAYVSEKLGKKPLLVLDDIFSELDSGHIDLVLAKTHGQQVILTTTHKEFIPESLQDSSMIELKKYD